MEKLEILLRRRYEHWSVWNVTKCWGISKISTQKLDAICFVESVNGPLQTRLIFFFVSVSNHFIFLFFVVIAVADRLFFVLDTVGQVG